MMKLKLSIKKILQCLLLFLIAPFSFAENEFNDRCLYEAIYEMGRYQGCKVGYSATDKKLDKTISESDCKSGKWCKEQFVDIIIKWDTETTEPKGASLSGVAHGFISIYRNKDSNQGARIYPRSLTGEKKIKLFKKDLTSILVDGSMRVLYMINSFPTAPERIGQSIGYFLFPDKNPREIKIPNDSKSIDVKFFFKHQVKPELPDNKDIGEILRFKGYVGREAEYLKGSEEFLDEKPQTTKFPRYRPK